MKIKEFEKFVEGRAKIPLDNLEYSFIGLGGEVGECLEWFKKSHYRKDSKFDTHDLMNELGDVLHYVQRIALEKGFTIKDCMEANIHKLLLRGMGYEFT